MNTIIKEHVERCVELYSQIIDVDFSKAIDRESHEQMRADLMIAVGMLAALNGVRHD